MKQPKIKLKVKVDRVCYPSPLSDGNWYIIDTDRGICKGNMAWRPNEGDSLVIEGDWSAYQGKKEFKFSGAIPNVPSDPRDQLRLVCERTHGVGYAIEEAIWNQYGDGWANDIKEGDVKGLKGRKYNEFLEHIDALTIEAEKNQAMAWLMGKGSTITMASAAWERWEGSTIGVVQADCYRLADLRGFGFKNVDSAIRINFGIADDDPRRIQAGILYSIRQYTSSGSTTISWPILKDHALKNIGAIHLQLLSDMVSEMFGSGVLRGFKATERISMGTDYENEALIYSYATREGNNHAA